ncbi:MAG: glutathione S-transferase [Sphingomonadales bacterium]|jgi:glutathione S-transferase|nr:glutathione S-transferase [Sphingomonadales bacterium]
MTVALYYHPFSSYCQKVLIAFYERDVPFEGVVIDLGDAAQRAALERLWPVAKFPVLSDEARGVTLPESSLIVEYLDRVHGGPPLVPAEPDAALEVHVLDRFFDNYVMTPMQKVVADNFRPEGQRDPYGVEESKAQLDRAYAILDDKLADGRSWAAGDSFSLADCAAAPALFYANLVQPFAGRSRAEAYYARLRARPSFARAVDEARPYRHFFPLPWAEGID